VNSGGGGGVELLARVDLVRPWIAEQMTKLEGGSAPPASGSSESGGSAPACKHDVCSKGKPLDPACSNPCAGAVCGLDAFCCTKEWDAQCVVEASFYCNACSP